MHEESNQEKWVTLPVEPSEQALHLKRLIVTLKHHYEKRVRELQAQLEFEQSYSLSLKDELQVVQSEKKAELEALKEEIEALQAQQKALKEILKKTQETLENKETIAFVSASPAPKEDPSEVSWHSPPPSDEWKKELEMIKRMLLEDLKERRTLQEQCLALSSEKAAFERETKQLREALQERSTHAAFLQQELTIAEGQQKELQERLQEKEMQGKEEREERLKLESQIEEWRHQTEERKAIQEQYLGRLAELEKSVESQRAQIKDLLANLEQLRIEKESLVKEKEELKEWVQEGESHLKTAQQHLAKKVKEAALLQEQLEDDELTIAELSQTIDKQKESIEQLQIAIHTHEREEIKWQNQLQELLKTQDTQISKWEEKYFQMCEKWQESENKVRELKKFEEKHRQLQALLANLGNLMGPSTALTSTAHFSLAQEIEKSASPLFFDAKESDVEKTDDKDLNAATEKLNLFGMREPLFRDES